MLRAQWLSDGRVDVPAAAIPTNLWEDLEEEAAKLEPGKIARDRSVPGLQVLRDGSITSPQRCHVHPGGDALISLVRHPALAETAREATGSDAMVPLRWGYKWYTHGDHMQVHRDEGKCTITFSAGLIGDLGTMGWLPRLRWLTSVQIAARFPGQDVFPDDDGTFPIERRILSGFDGVRVPHWRPPYEHDLGVLVTCCFAARL
ncbi:hypothetical protein [Actinomadura rupiterrae]|uniref:hypothetical protein n=1 Tax=Actinomadura rupiterrae TaxID=559627 RepID=UPI0020A3C03E|nr:hypothetical protein [Actinomadura rupiterrae]MCP2342054.1 hypothetical protein [Actinomadura rupiterrae]